MLGNSPHVAMGLMERVITLRDDLGRKERNEALESCKEVFTKRKLPGDKTSMSSVWRRVAQAAPAAVVGHSSTRSWFQSGASNQTT